MTHQAAVALTDQSWTEVASGSEFVTLATQDFGGFFAMVGAAQPPTDQDLAAAFFGKPGQPVSYVGLLHTDKVWARAHSSSIKIAVAKSS